MGNLKYSPRLTVVKLGIRQGMSMAAARSAADAMRPDELLEAAQIAAEKLGFTSADVDFKLLSAPATGDPDLTPAARTDGPVRHFVYTVSLSQGCRPVGPSNGFDSEGAACGYAAAAADRDAEPCFYLVCCSAVCPVVYASPDLEAITRRRADSSASEVE